LAQRFDYPDALLGDADRTVVALSLVLGVLASAVQLLGLIRWPFLVCSCCPPSSSSGASSLPDGSLLAS
jgi:hypothetical protein